MLLHSKVQYKYYEPGEFISIAEKTLEEAEELITHYPWNEQRFHQPIGFTGPSITFRNTEGTYLKLGAGYNHKFNLYLFTAQGRLFRKTVNDLSTALGAVRDFYFGKDPEDFKRVKFVFNAKKHFETKSFEYKITAGRVLAFSWFNVGLLSAFLLYFPITDVGAPTWPVLLPFWFVFAGVNLIFLLNYWWYDRDTIIKISAGRDDFWVSRDGEVRYYNKKDVKEVRYYESPGSKNPWNGNNVIEIELKNGEVIKFTNLLIPMFKFLGKINVPYRQVDKYFPFVKK